MPSAYGYPSGKAGKKARRKEGVGRSTYTSKRTKGEVSHQRAVSKTSASRKAVGKASSPFRKRARAIRRTHKERTGTKLATQTAEAWLRAAQQRQKERNEDRDDGGFSLPSVEEILSVELPGTSGPESPSVIQAVRDVGRGSVPKTTSLTVADVAGAGAAGVAGRVVGRVAGRVASKETARVAGKKVMRGPTKKPGRVKVARSKVKAEKKAKATKRATKRKDRPTVVKKAGEATEPIRRHKYAAGTGAVIAGPGAVAGVKMKDPKKLTAPFEGLGRAVASDPGKVLGTTARSIPGLLTAPIGLAANVGTTAYRAGTTATGLKKYSGKEITEPTTTAAKEVYGFGKRMAEDLGSGDPARIEKAIEEDYGLTPFVMAGIPGLRVAGKLGAGKAVSKAARKTPGVKKAPKALDRRAARREVAKDVAMAQRKGSARAVGKRSRKGSKEVPGLETITRSLSKAKGKRGTVRRARQKVTPEHTLKTLAEQGITKPAHVERLLKRHKRPVDAPVDRVVTADVAQFLKDNPTILTDKNVNKAWDDLGKMQKAGYETSPVAKNLPQAITWDVPLPWQRKGWTENPKTKAQGDANAQVEAAFLRDMEALQKREGLAEPIWTHDSDVMRRGASGLPGSVRGYQGRSAYRTHRTKGILQEQGRADQSFEALAVGSIVEPRMKRAINENTERFVEKSADTLPVGKGGKAVRVMTEKEAARAERLGLLEGRAVMDAQGFKAAVLDPTTEKTNVPAFVQSVERATQEVYARKAAGDPSAKGRSFVAISEPKLKEFLRQHHRVSGDIEKGLGKLQRGSSRALLGYSPSWLAAQPIAEGAQALASQGVVNTVRGLYEYRKMDAKTKAEFDSNLGSGAGTGAIRDVGVALDELSPKTSRVGQALQRSKSGRLAWGILSGRYANKIDRTKAQAIRRGVAAGKLTKEYDKMRVGMRGILREDNALRGKSRQEVFRHYARNPDARKKLEGYVDDVMGNWDALTARERALSKVVIFYPFVRMSLNWVFHTYPKRHPVKASIMHFLGQFNAEQLEKAYGGDPSFFTQWANAPLYTGKDGKIGGLLPLSRIAPGSNALIEALGSSEDPNKLRAALRATNPFFGATAAALSGTLPESGRAVNFGRDTETLQAAGLFFRALVTLPTPFRAVDTLTGKKYTDAMIGREMTKTRRLFELINEPRGKRVLRSFAVPFLPQDIGPQRFMTDVGRLLNKKYTGTDNERSRATDLLDRLYKRFGLEDESEDPEPKKKVRRSTPTSSIFN